MYFVPLSIVAEELFMKFRLVLLSILSFIILGKATAQETANYTQPRILFLLDESSSMLQQWSNGKPKHKMANEIIERLMDSVMAVNNNVQFSLRVFGNQHTVSEHDCTDTKNEVPFSPDNRTQMSFRLDDMRPLGVTAIAYSLSEAAEKDLIDEKHYAYSIILITDGGESCNGDICGVMQKLLKNKIFFKPYVLSLEDVPELKDEYACMGNYLSVTKQADITKAVSRIVESFRPMLAISQSDFHKLQVIAAKAPSALKVNAPVIKTEVPVEDKPKKVDTVKPEIKPEPAKPKTSSIIVGEEPKRPAPVTINKMATRAMAPMFVGRTKLKPLPVATAKLPEITVSEEDITVPHDGPVTLAAVPAGKYKKIKVPHVVFGSMPVAMQVTLDIKGEEPVLPPVAVKLPKVAMPAYRKLAVAKSTPVVYRPMPAKLEIKETPIEEVVVHNPAKMEAIRMAAMNRFTVAPVVAKAVKKMKVDMPEIKTELPEPEVPAVVHTATTLPKLKPGRFRMHLLYVNTFLDSDLKPLKVMLPEIKATPEPAPVAATPVKPTKPTTPVKPTTPPAKPVVAKTGEYTVTHEDNPETTLEVYLTNGKGKFYASTPRVFLLDPANGKELKRFFRTVDASGNPDPVTNVVTGKYDLTIAGRDDLLAHVEIVPNKRNKVYVKVKNFSLEFKYEHAPDRPVKEFTATVIQRNVDNGKVVMQKCYEKLEYEPGNYHIIINTFPEDIRNIDLDDLTSRIDIPQPGFAKFTLEVPATNNITLWRELGDKFLQFATISMTDPALKHLAMQPGKYQVHYNNGTSKYSSSEKVLVFQVKSTQETEIVLAK